MTPFEIRLDILKMVQDMLDKETKANETAYLAKIDVLKEINISSVEAFIDTNKPKNYTTDELVTRSQTLYNFVNSNKGNTT